MVMNGLCNVRTWIGIIIAFTTLKITGAENPYLLAIKTMDLRVTQWLNNSLINYPLTPQEEESLIKEYGEKNGQLLPSLRTVPKFYLLNARRYHLFILHTATTMKNAGPGFALLRLKFLAFIKSLRYINCSLVIQNSDLPKLPYCKELAFAFLDFTLIGIDDLCKEVAKLMRTKNVKYILTNFVTAIKKFDNKFRKRLNDIESTPKNFRSLSKFPDVYNDNIGNDLAQDILYKLAEEEDDMLLSSFDNLNKLILSKMHAAPANTITSVTLKSLKNAIVTCIEAEDVYYNSLSQEGELNFVKALRYGDIKLLKQFKYFDYKPCIYDQLEHISDGKFEVDETAISGTIVIQSVG